MSDSATTPGKPASRAGAEEAGIAVEARLQALQEATAQLLTATTPEAVAEVLLHCGMRGAGATHGALYLRKDNHIELVAAQGDPAGLTTTLERIALDADMPLTLAARRGEMLYFPTPDARASRFPQMAGFDAGQTLQASAYVPLSSPQALLGALSLGFDLPDAIGPREQAFIKSLAGLAAQAFERIHLAGVLNSKLTDQENIAAQLSNQSRLLDMSTDAILVRDASNRIIYWNRSAELLYGYTREEVLGNETFTLLKQRFPQPFDEVMQTLWREGHWEGELGQTRRDGSQITVLTRWVLDRAPGTADKSASILVINTDITARKQAEQMLREHQDMLALTMRGGRIGAWWRDLEANVAWWSREMEEIFGLAPDGFAGSKDGFFEFAHPDDQPAISQSMEQAILNRTDFAVEFRFRHANGSMRWMESRGRATHDAGGRALRLYGIGLDITDRKLAEMDAQFLGNLGQIFSGEPDPQALMWQASSAIAMHLSANRAGFATFDVARQQAVIHRDYSASWPSIAGTYQLWWLGSSLMNDLHAGRMFIIEDVLADSRTAGAYTQVLEPVGMRSVVLAPLLRMGRCVAGLFVTREAPHAWAQREIELMRTVAERTWLAVESARVQAETQALNSILETRVAERTEALKQSREQLRRLSVHVEHAREDERARIAREVHDELGGALTVLKMSLSQVMKRSGADAGVSMRLEDMGAQIDALVQNVRRISYDLRPSMLDDFGLLAAMEWQASEWQHRTGIACRLVCEPNLRAELNDRIRTAVFRVFQESLTNIARHSQASEVIVSVHQDEDRLVLSVKDNGRGMSEEAQHSNKSLGLAGMRERIRELGGDVEIVSPAGGGVTVTMLVPLQHGS